MRLVNRRRVYEKRMIPIEYLEANNPNGQLDVINCINTGYIPKSNNVRINTKIMWKDYSSTYNTDWFGGYSFVDNKMHGIGIGPVLGNKTSLKINYNNYNQRNIYSVEQGGIYEIYLRSDICIINGQIISVTSPVTDGSENTAPIYLFRSSMTGASGYASGFQGHFYYFQIYEGDQLVMDLRPVRISTTGYMYDKVSGRLFKNGATKGKFILGPDIPYIPDIPYPDIHYDKVEYLESTGTQWIDTGINPMTAPSAIADIEIMDSGNYDLWGNGLSGSNGNFICNVQNYELKFYRYGSYTSYNFGLIGEGRHVITTDQRLIVDGSLVYQSSYTYTHDSRQKNIWIFNASRKMAPASMKLYSFKLYDAGELVRDYIPVRVGTAGYLYDKVSGKLFGNQGTGEFILGPDVK